MPYGYDKPLETFGVRFTTSDKPSKKFSKLIEKDLPTDSNNISIALKLYNNLNKNVIFSEEFSAFGQDLSLDFLKKIYDIPINMINRTNNEITCNSWAKLYSYFLEKHNIPCVINGNLHKCVYFKESGYLFKADATTTNKNKSDNFYMNDLTRSRLGLRPCGLTAFILDEELGAKEVNIYDLDIHLAPETEIDYVNFEDRVNTILSRIKNNTNFQIKNLPFDTDEILDKFSLINKLIMEVDMDSIATIEYINNLIKIIFNKEEQKYFAYVYLKEKQGNRYKYTELINFGEERNHKHDYNLGSPSNLEGYNFIYRGKGLEYLTPRKARKIISESACHDINITSKR